MRVYKDIFYRYVTTALLGAVIIGVVMGLTIKNQWYLAVGVVVWMLLCTGFWEYWARRRTKKFDDSFDNCRMKEFLDDYVFVIAGTPKDSDDYNKNKLLLKYADGLYALGQFEDMNGSLRGLYFIEHPSKKDEAQKAEYCIRKALYFVENNRLDEAEMQVDECYRLMNLNNFNAKQTKELETSCEKIIEMINMREGHLDGAEEKFQKWFDEATTNLEKVECMFRLGEIRWARGEDEKADEAFRFAVDNGGDTFYARRAWDVLNRKGKHKVNLSVERIDEAKV